MTFSDIASARLDAQKTVESYYLKLQCDREPIWVVRGSLDINRAWTSEFVGTIVLGDDDTVDTVKAKCHQVCRSLWQYIGESMRDQNNGRTTRAFGTAWSPKSPELVNADD